MYGNKDCTICIVTEDNLINKKCIIIYKIKKQKKPIQYFRVVKKVCQKKFIFVILGIIISIKTTLYLIEKEN